MIFPTKAVILAAGIGKRLAGGKEQPPKCLLEFNGKSLLQRHLDLLSGCGITEVILGVGYRAELIKAEVSAINPAPAVHFEYNPQFNQGSVVTLWTLRDHLADGRELLLMDADVLYDFRLLERLIYSDHSNCLLMDRDIEPGEEPVKLCVRQGQLVEFGKQVNTRYDFCGESVGFFRFSPDIARQLASVAQEFIDNGRRDEPYEEVLREVLLANPTKFRVEDVTGLPWIEIDFQEDLNFARNRILPQLRE